MRVAPSGYSPLVDALNLVVVGSGPAGVSAARAYREAGGTGPVHLLTADTARPTNVRRCRRSSCAASPSFRHWRRASRRSTTSPSPWVTRSRTWATAGFAPPPARSTGSPPACSPPAPSRCAPGSRAPITRTCGRCGRPPTPASCARPRPGCAARSSSAPGSSAARPRFPLPARAPGDRRLPRRRCGVTTAASRSGTNATARRSASSPTKPTRTTSGAGSWSGAALRFRQTEVRFRPGRPGGMS